MEKAREKIYGIQSPVPPACNSDAENNFDFNLLNSAQPVFLADLAWGFFTASKNEKQRVGQVEALVHTVAYRAIFHKETLAEAEALARELMKMRRQYGAWSVQSMATIQPSQSHSWCSFHDLLMLGLLGNESGAVVAERSWRKAFSTKIEKNGDLETKEQAIAWRALGYLAQIRPLEKETFESILNLINDDSRPDLESLDEVLKGLAYQWDLVSADADAKILRALSKYDDEAVQRQLVEEVSAVALTLADPPQRKGCMERLMTAWKSETEPELRMSIARELGRTVFLR